MIVKNIITLNTTKGLLPELSFVESVNQNVISIKVLNIGKNPKIEIYYGCDFRELTGMNGNEFFIPSEYCSDNEIIHFRYIDDDSESKFVHVVGNESAYENLKLIQKSSYLFVCSGTKVKNQEIDYLEKLAGLISPMTLANEKSCYDDLFRLEELFNKQLVRLGGTTGETVSESVQRLSDIEILSPGPDRYVTSIQYFQFGGFIDKSMKVTLREVTE